MISCILALPANIPFSISVFVRTLWPLPTLVGISLLGIAREPLASGWERSLITKSSLSSIRTHRSMTAPNSEAVGCAAQFGTGSVRGGVLSEDENMRIFPALRVWFLMCEDSARSLGHKSEAGPLDHS